MGAGKTNGGHAVPAGPNGYPLIYSSVDLQRSPCSAYHARGQDNSVLRAGTEITPMNIKGNPLKVHTGDPDIPREDIRITRLHFRSLLTTARPPGVRGRPS